MKKLITIILLVIIGLRVEAQTDTCFTKDHIIRIATKLNDLETQHKFDTAKIGSLEFRLNKMTEAYNFSESKTVLLTKENEIYKTAITNFTGIEFNKGNNKNKFFDNKTVCYIGGIVTGVLILYTGAKIARSI